MLNTLQFLFGDKSKHKPTKEKKVFRETFIVNPPEKIIREEPIQPEIIVIKDESNYEKKKPPPMEEPPLYISTYSDLSYEYVATLSDKNYHRQQINKIVETLSQKKKVTHSEGCIFFIYGPTGCGKTFVWKEAIRKCKLNYHILRMDDSLNDLEKRIAVVDDICPIIIEPVELFVDCQINPKSSQSKIKKLVSELIQLQAKSLMAVQPIIVVGTEKFSDSLYDYSKKWSWTEIQVFPPSVSNIIRLGKSLCLEREWRWIDEYAKFANACNGDVRSFLVAIEWNAIEATLDSNNTLRKVPKNIFSVARNIFEGEAPPDPSSTILERTCRLWDGMHSDKLEKWVWGSYPSYLSVDFNKRLSVKQQRAKIQKETEGMSEKSKKDYINAFLAPTEELFRIADAYSDEASLSTMYLPYSVHNPCESVFEVGNEANALKSYRVGVIQDVCQDVYFQQKKPKLNFKTKWPFPAKIPSMINREMVYYLKIMAELWVQNYFDPTDPAKSKNPYNFKKCVGVFLSRTMLKNKSVWVVKSVFENEFISADKVKKSRGKKRKKTQDASSRKKFKESARLKSWIKHLYHNYKIK